MGRCFFIEKSQHKIDIFSKVKNDHGMKVGPPKYSYQGVITRPNPCHGESTCADIDGIFRIFW